MGLVTGIGIGAFALATIGAFVDRSARVEAAESEIENAVSQQRALDAARTEEQGQVNEDARREKSLRVREAESEMAALNVAIGEQNLSASTAARMTAAVGYSEGFDLSSIEINRKRQIRSLQSEKEAGFRQTQNRIERAENSVPSLGVTFLGIAGTGLSIAGDINRQRGEEERARNRRP